MRRQDGAFEPRRGQGRKEAIDLPGGRRPVGGVEARKGSAEQGTEPRTADLSQQIAGRPEHPERFGVTRDLGEERAEPLEHCVEVALGAHLEESLHLAHHRAVPGGGEHVAQPRQLLADPTLGELVFLGRSAERREPATTREQVFGACDGLIAPRSDLAGRQEVCVVR